MPADPGRAHRSGQQLHLLWPRNVEILPKRNVSVEPDVRLLLGRSAQLLHGVLPVERRAVTARRSTPVLWGRHAPPPSSEVNSEETPPTRRRSSSESSADSSAHQTVCR